MTTGRIEEKSVHIRTREAYLNLLADAILNPNHLVSDHPGFLLDAII
jgi:hypothetical protein